MTLKQWKKSKGATYQYVIQELAKMGVTVGRVQLSNVFTGKAIPGTRLLIGLVRLTGVEYRDILEDRDG